MSYKTFSFNPLWEQGALRNGLWGQRMNPSDGLIELQHVSVKKGSPLLQQLKLVSDTKANQDGKKKQS